MTTELIFRTLEDVPMVQSGDDLVAIIIHALAQGGQDLQPGDILILAQKIVSKAEGRRVELASVTVSPEAEALAAEAGKDPRQMQLLLDESREIVAKKPGVVIVEQNLGIVMANAGIDASNIEGVETVLLLPEDPDATCAAIGKALKEKFGVDVGVIINDSVGRPWRLGTVGLAIGVYGLPAVWDLRGDVDLFNRELMVSEQAVADELASAASLLQGQAAEGRPIVLARGLKIEAPSGTARDLVRAKDEDMFR
jgi:coenzyme F420-0:L-glutamate ligase/coenzyme F420-1:gamma-L-glutamate ligase